MYFCAFWRASTCVIHVSVFVVEKWPKLDFFLKNDPKVGAIMVCIFIELATLESPSLLTQEGGYSQRLDMWNNLHFKNNLH